MVDFISDLFGISQDSVYIWIALFVGIVVGMLVCRAWRRRPDEYR